jgi:hypothetical protein
LQTLFLDDNDNSIEVTGKIQPGDYFQFSKSWTTRKFSVSLPSGSYTAQFVDEVGNQVWPTYVEELWEAEPDCSTSAGPLDITLSKTHIDISDCNELIRNGGQDGILTTSEPWAHTDPGLQVGSGLGVNAGDAIITINRGGSWTGLGQSIDSRCVDKLAGKYVEFSAWIRMTNKDGTPATNINPDTDWWRRNSPVVTLNAKQFRDESTKEYIWNQEISDVAQMARPYKSNGFNLVHGIFQMPSTPHLFVEIDSAPDNIQFHLDDVSMRPFDCNRDQLVRTGDLEEMSATKFWDTWGNPKLDVTTGYGGVGNAVKASARSHYSHGPAQQINFDCGAKGEIHRTVLRVLTLINSNSSSTSLSVGDRVLFQARIRFETGGAKTSCNINTWDGSTRCSDIFFYTDKSGTRQYYRVGQIVTDDPDADGW